MKNLRGVVLGVLSLLVVSFPLNAQQFSAVSGVVSDTSGGVVSGVTVELNNEQMGVHQTTTTNDLGFYQFLRQTPGQAYSLTFSKEGFAKLVVSNISLGVSTTETRNISLEVGAVTQSISVEAAGEATLNTADATIGNVIDARAVSELPIQFRLDAANLMQLQAGVNDAGSITGARSDQGNITLDGLDINDQATGQAFSSTIPVSVDALQEVRTVTAGETADYGRSSGGGINLVTKGGSNNWHGNLREYNRNTLFAANDWFNNRSHVARPALIRNQFGGNLGGPVKKDKLFFFFDYEGLRRSSSSQNVRAVPTAQFRAGQLGYINSNAGCDGTARFTTQPNCITYLQPSDVMALDPRPGPGAGDNAALLSFINSRYPATINDPGAAGDGINTDGFLFTAPVHETENVYTGRIDYNLTAKHKLFLRSSVARHGIDDDFNVAIEQFPGDPAPSSRDTFNGYASSIGWTWTATPNLISQFSAGLVRAILDFPTKPAPTFPNSFFFSPNISNPFLGSSSQSRNVPVPEFREGLTWIKGNHTMDFGGDLKLIRQISALKNDFNFIGIGLGGEIQSLDTAPQNQLRPSDINGDPSAVSDWDNFFPFMLGRYSQVFSNFNYDRSGNAFPSGTGKKRDYNYNEFEFYSQDSWKLRSDLTITYGLRYLLHSVPYEINGFQSIPSVNENAYLSARQTAAAQGVSGISAVPIMSYSLGGAANSAPGYYKPDYKDFGPRIGLAYNPGFRGGLLGNLFGDRKSTVRVGGAILHDRISGGASFGLDQNTFLFDSGANNPFGVTNDPITSLQTDPRFNGLNTSLPPFPAAPSTKPPVQPNVFGGQPLGLAFGGFPSFFQFDRNTKSPYAIVLNFGFQRELPGNLLLEAGYVGRLGRRLLAVGDAATVTDFKDNASATTLRQGFAALQQQVLNHVGLFNIVNAPWFENQMGGTANCQAFSQAVFGISLTCSQIAVGLNRRLFRVGDLSDTVQALFADGFLDFNVGLPAQTGANGYIGNYASSNYNAMLVSLRKRVSNGLQFDFNYTFSHSIDNVSEITNNYVTYTGSGAGLVCELDNLRICRADSDFDARHTINVNYIYDLPIGQGRRFLRNSPGWANAIVGGWTTSSIITWRTGYPFTVHTLSFPTAFTLDAPAVLLNAAGLKQNIHTDSAGELQYFASQSTAVSAFAFPFGGGTGTRNAVRGPGFSSVDMAIEKSINLPKSERQRLKLRMDTFNTFNHPVFNGPASATLNNTSQFGIITSTASSPRVLQVSLRYEF
ncbi:MAG TPA: TonB-dependent receptor [Candidatus Acidoferrum sp.]|nr:TonB-dependent receptor [Candidatus Acidoferrum sp.]